MSKPLFYVFVYVALNHFVDSNHGDIEDFGKIFVRDSFSAMSTGLSSFTDFNNLVLTKSLSPTHLTTSFGIILRCCIQPSKLPWRCGLL